MTYIKCLSKRHSQSILWQEKTRGFVNKWRHGFSTTALTLIAERDVTVDDNFIAACSAALSFRSLHTRARGRLLARLQFNNPRRDVTNFLAANHRPSLLCNDEPMIYPNK